MRDSTLHIKKSDLVKILKQINIRRGMTEEELVVEIFNNASPFQLRTRYLDLLNKKAEVQKKIKRTVQADKGVPEHTVEIFNRLLASKRQTLSSHIRVKPITADHKDYVLLKEVAKLAHEFTEQFNIKPIETGYLTFIELGLAKMRKYGLNRFKTYANSITESFANSVEVMEEMDKDEQGFRDFLITWQEKMEEYCGEGLEGLYKIENNNDKLIHLVHGKREADELEAPYEYWIEAQFDGLAFLDAIPELSQFYGENAKGRYERFLKKSIELVKEDEEINEVKKNYYE